MTEAQAAVDLGLELGVGAAFVVAMVAVHSFGLVSISKLLRLERDRLLKHEFNLRAIGLLSAFGLMMLALHIAEIFVFALFYAKVGASPSLADALFYSASAYVTLGLQGDLAGGWRLIGALEALIGFVLIGWSTAFMVSTMRNLALEGHR